MDNNAALTLMKSDRVVAIVRGILPADMSPLVDALFEGGVRCIEFTFDHSGLIDSREMLKSLTAIRLNKGNSVALGVGTVLTAGQAEMAADAGAQFVLSPDFSPAVVEKTKELGLLSIPGAMTPSEITAAYACGADIVKLFPAGSLGIGYLKAIRGPLPHIPISAVGGIGAANAAEFIEAGAACLGIGGELIDTKLVAYKNFAAITAAARKIMDIVSAAKKL